MLVLAAPVLIQWFENRCVAAIEAYLPEDSATISMATDFIQVSPVPLGYRVEVLAQLVEIDGDTLSFHVEAFDSHGIVATATHHRVTVARARFMANLERKMATPEAPLMELGRDFGAPRVQLSLKAIERRIMRELVIGWAPQFAA